MDPNSRGSFRLFQVAGISVYLHWSWFLFAWVQISMGRQEEYQLGAWKVVEYVSIFAIVLLHEFGHALACRSVGGEANRIVLWPLGGIAYVAPPARPGPVLWSIAAGPLVNLVLVLPTFAIWYVGDAWNWRVSSPDVYLFLRNISVLNVLLLVFNLLPIYPLDGGQIVHALLWFALDRWRSLMVVSLVGLILGTCSFLLCFSFFLLFGLLGRDLGGGFGLLALIAAFVALRSLVAFQQAREMLTLQELPRHDTCRCPGCGTAPPRGAFWVCDHCTHRFDLFAERGKCPACGAWYLHPDCPNCRVTSHIDQWFAAKGQHQAPAPPDGPLGPGGEDPVRHLP